RAIGASGDAESVFAGTDGLRSASGGPIADGQHGGGEQRVARHRETHRGPAAGHGAGAGGDRRDVAGEGTRGDVYAEPAGGRRRAVGVAVGGVEGAAERRGVWRGGVGRGGSNRGVRGAREETVRRRGRHGGRSSGE